MVAVLNLVRWAYGPEETLGLLKFPVREDGSSTYALWTVECPWQGNAPFMSAIPDGSYPLVAFESPKHPDSWVITPVPGRTGILIHAGNKVADVTGCVAVGITRSDMCVWESQDAMRLLNYVLNRSEQHTIHVGPGMGAQLANVDSQQNDVQPSGDSGPDSGGLDDLARPGRDPIL